MSYIKKISSEENIFGDNIAMVEMWDFSKANINDESRIEAITTVASICYNNPNVIGKESLYNRLKAEAMGLPSSSFEFVPILLNRVHIDDIYEQATYHYSLSNIQNFELNIEKYGEWIEDGEYLLTNYRALLSDHEIMKNVYEYYDITQIYNTEEECSIIAKYSKTFLAKMDISTSKQHNRHRASLQEMCLTGDSKITTSQGTRTIKELYDNQFRKSANKLPSIKTYDFKKDLFVKSEINEVFDTGVKEVFEVKIQFGANGDTYSIKTSKDHKFLTDDGWKRLEDLKEKDFVAINGEIKHKNFDYLKRSRQHMIDNSITVSEWAIELDVSDRTLKKYLKKFNLYYTSKDFKKPFYQQKDWLLEQKEVLLKQGIGQKGFSEIHNINQNTLKKWMHHHGIFYTPSEVCSTYETWNKGMVGEDSHVFGMVHSDETRQKISDRLVYEIGSTKNGYAQRMRSYWEADFRRRKIYDKFDGRCAECGSDEKIEYDHILPVSRFPQKGFSYDNMQLLCKKCHKAKSSNENTYGNETYKLGMIISIKSCGEQQTYDLEVDHSDHNYIANKIVVHNSRRYVSGKKSEFEFYNPTEINSFISEHADDESSLHFDQDDLNKISVERYFQLLKNGVQPQSARRILPQSMYTTIWTSFLPFQLKNYLALRDDKHAQQEIMWLAQAMKRLLKV